MVEQWRRQSSDYPSLRRTRNSSLPPLLGRRGGWCSKFSFADDSTPHICQWVSLTQSVGRSSLCITSPPIIRNTSTYQQFPRVDGETPVSLASARKWVRSQKNCHLYLCIRYFQTLEYVLLDSALGSGLYLKFFRIWRVRKIHHRRVTTTYRSRTKSDKNGCWEDRKSTKLGTL